LVTALGHPEWIGENEAAYVQCAVDLCKAVPLRRTLRAAQREK
jgi:predicted O-linked N-acetylglucosamine transferase (SPINDLY family)